MAGQCHIGDGHEEASSRKPNKFVVMYTHAKMMREGYKGDVPS
jgi:hypothetical protein